MKTLHAVIEGLGFEKDVEILRTSINRPELLIQATWIPKCTHNKAMVLRFLFDNGPGQPILRPSQIPKTLVFFDSKNDAYTAMKACRYWLQHNRQPDEANVQHCNYTLQEAMDTVKVYHSNTAKADKEAMIKELQKPGSKSKLRVLMTTEALALGVDLWILIKSSFIGSQKTYNQQLSGNAVVGRVASDRMGRLLFSLISGYREVSRKVPRSARFMQTTMI
jgi:hypothetical protein